MRLTTTGREATEHHFAFTGSIGHVRFDFGHRVEQSPAEKLDQHIKMD